MNTFISTLAMTSGGINMSRSMNQYVILNTSQMECRISERKQDDRIIVLMSSLPSSCQKIDVSAA